VPGYNTSRMSNVLPFTIVIVAAIVAFVAGAFLARRKTRARPEQTYARCRRGHLFVTMWGGRGSFRMLDLGWARIQRCPVGDHLTLVYPVDESGLSAEQKKQAKKYRDAVKERPRV
jgi:hypothetical protein